MKTPITAAKVAIVPMRAAQVIALVPLTDWLDVSAFSDLYIPMLNTDGQGDTVIFHVEMAEDVTHPFAHRPSFTLAPGEADAFIERGTFARFIRLSAQSDSAEPVDVRFGVYGKGNDRGVSEGTWKLG